MTLRLIFQNLVTYIAIQIIAGDVDACMGFHKYTHAIIVTILVKMKLRNSTLMFSGQNDEVRYHNTISVVLHVYTKSSLFTSRYTHSLLDSIKLVCV